MCYTIEELKILRDFRAKTMDNSFMDDEHGTDKSFFLNNTDIFLEWLTKMEKRNKIQTILKQLNEEQKG